MSDDLAAAFDDNREHQRWAHEAVRGLVNQRGGHEARLGMLVSLATASTTYADPADRRAFIDWHVRRLDGWLTEPLITEN